MAINIPFDQPIALPPDPDDSAPQVAAALAAFQAGQSTASAYRERLNAITARYPTCLNAWAALGELALPDDVIAASPSSASATTGVSTVHVALLGGVARR